MAKEYGEVMLIHPTLAYKKKGEEVEGKDLDFVVLAQLGNVSPIVGAVTP